MADGRRSRLPKGSICPQCRKQVTTDDLPVLHAAASALRHAPPHMRAAHLAERLEEIAGRVEALERVATLMPAVLECRERAATTQESLHVGGDDAETSTDT